MAACRKTVSMAWRNTSSTFQQVRNYSAPVDGSIPGAKQKYIPKSGSYPKGFLVSGIHVGVKPSNKTLPDLTIISSEVPASAAAVFTKNKFQAAPVTVSRETLQKRSGKGIRAIIINSGCANAVTGKGGLEDANSMAAAVDKQYSENTDQVSSTLVMSTGVIGQRLPIQKIISAVPKAFENLDNTHQSWLTIARAICTTDTFPKLLSTTFTLPSSPGTTYSLAGITKGAGMIHPNMATLLGILCTDAPIHASTLQPLLTHAVDRSFNAISIDGDTSTNDTVALLANGAAGGQPIESPKSEDGIAMQEILTSFTQQLSQLVVRDGEGATKFVQIRVINSPSFADARLIASTIARSPLVKCALYGKDANWGRILCAIGYTQGLSQDAVIPEQTSVSFVPTDGTEPLKLLFDGEPESVDEIRASQILAEEDLEILVDLGKGGGREHEASYWTCDFSHEYVTINGDYRT
ncbi:hypothetical protein OEA41_006045 [Lepraria neglecta]|uniref:Arginine biosynthesis bifunctional protein ArgJ, mitochondrial n=1 Tax=Lepraria neglecta TaxID=209136 RepID=A0AAE0DK91_9LECA|nr:hypothetical protein OEA41_006045 [Lepraria neglecta]